MAKKPEKTTHESPVEFAFRWPRSLSLPYEGVSQKTQRQDHYGAGDRTLVNAPVPCPQTPSAYAQHIRDEQQSCYKFISTTSRVWRRQRRNLLRENADHAAAETFVADSANPIFINPDFSSSASGLSAVPEQKGGLDSHSFYLPQAGFYH